MIQLGQMSRELSRLYEFFCDFHLQLNSDFSHWVNIADLDCVLQTSCLWFISFNRYVLFRPNIKK